MSYITPVILMLIFSGLQGNYPSYLSILDAKPDFLLVILLTYSLDKEPDFGAILGFVAGLIQGSIVGFAFGSFLISRTVTGFLAGLVTTRVFGDNPLVPVVSATWLTLLCEVLFLIVNPPTNFLVAIPIIIGKCIYNSFFTILLYAFIKGRESRKKTYLIQSRYM